MSAFRTSLVCALFAAAFIPASAASVEVNAMTPTLSSDTVMKRVVVKFDDLNPADSQGATALLDRINRAAAIICASNPGGTGPMLTDKVEKCRVKAVKQAVRDIGSAELAAAAGK